jgi:hypothetical protein
MSGFRYVYTSVSSSHSSLVSATGILGLRVRVPFPWWHRDCDGDMTGGPAMVACGIGWPTSTPPIQL